MSHLDEELRTALRREEPSEGFVNRVLERLPAEPPRAAIARQSMARTWLAAAAAVVLATGAIWLTIPGVPEPNVGKLVTPGPAVPPEPSKKVQPPDAAPPPRPESQRPAPAPPRHAPRPQPRPRDDAEALHAAEQLRTALDLTSDKFRFAQREVREALVPES
jgi:hypothetical protein